MLRKNYTEEELTRWKRTIDNVLNSLSLGLTEFECDIDDITEKCCLYVKIVDVSLHTQTTQLPSLRADLVVEKHVYSSKVHYPSNEADFMQSFYHSSSNIPYCLKFKVYDMGKASTLIGEEELPILNTYQENVEQKTLYIYRSKKEPEIFLKLNYSESTNCLTVCLEEGRKFLDAQNTPMSTFAKLKVLFKTHDKKKHEKEKIKTPLIEDEPSPLWRVVEIFEPPESTSTVSIFVDVFDNSKKLLMSSREICVDLLKLESDPIQQWYTLHRKKRLKDQPIGAITVETSIRRELLLPEAKYDLLYRTIVDNKMYIVKLIDTLCKDIQEKREILKPLVRVLEWRCDIENFMGKLLLSEVVNAWDPSVLFRENSGPCLAMELHLHFVGQKLLQKVLEGPLKHFKSLNIQFNPDEKEHMDVFFECLDTIWDNITDCIDDIPHSIRRILRDVKDKSREKFKEDENICVTNFMFLRFYCVAIAYPHHFDLITYIPDRPMSKFLLLLSKTLMNLANASESKGNNSRINVWIEDNADQMEMYIEAVVDVEDQDPVLEGGTDYQRDMFSLHSWLSKHVHLLKAKYDELTDLAKKKKSSSAKSLKSSQREEKPLSNKIMPDVDKRSRSRSGSSVTDDQSLSKSANLPEPTMNGSDQKRKLREEMEYRDFLDRVLQCVMMLNDMVKNTGRSRSLSFSG